MRTAAPWTRPGAPAPALAPAWAVSQWLNSEPLTVDGLQGKVVVVAAFQMLCPACVSHGLPQALRLRETFDDDVAVIALHTVFEHHAAMTPVALAAFAHEYRLSLPIGVDEHDTAGRPVTFTAYGMRGTPTTVLIDRYGRIAAQHFGAVADMPLAAAVTRLLIPGGDRAPSVHAPVPRDVARCDATTGICS